MTKQPVYVDRRLAVLCRSVTPEELDAARKASGPHALSAVRIFMNNPAAQTFGKPSPRYPIGSIIVKEKQALGLQPATQPGDSQKSTDGVAGMIKRDPGYDPTHGDWEYFYFDAPDKVASGKLTSCIECHTSAADNDYIFGDWSHPTQ